MIKPKINRKHAHAVLTRRFELGDSSPVDIYLWRPEVEDDGTTWRCDWKIVGLLGDKMRFSCGMDSYQAHALALQSIGAYLYYSDAWKDGRLTWLGHRELGLPTLPGERPAEGGFAPAELLSSTGGMTVVRLPDMQMPSIAWSEALMAEIVRRLDGVQAVWDTDLAKARTRLARVLKGLKEERGYYEAVCRQAGFPPPPVGHDKKEL